MEKHVKKTGFTLVEMIIVIVIVAILSLVAVPMYRAYVRKAMLTEAKTLIGALEKHERIYYSEFAKYLPFTSTDAFIGGTLDIHVASNKYFRNFEVKDVTEDGFVIVCRGEGTAAHLILRLTANKTSSDLMITDLLQ